MRRIALVVAVVATLGGGIAYVVPAHGQAGKNAGPINVTAIPAGYRDWRLISVAHEEGNLHSFAAILGNDVAIKAYRDRTLPFPDGAIIAALPTAIRRRRRTTRSLAASSRSWPARPRTFSS